MFCLCILSNLLCVWIVLWNTYWPCLTVSSYLMMCICFPGPSPAGCALCGPARQKAKCLSACPQSQWTFPTLSSFTAWLACHTCVHSHNKLVQPLTLYSLASLSYLCPVTTNLSSPSPFTACHTCVHSHNKLVQPLILYSLASLSYLDPQSQRTFPTLSSFPAWLACHIFVHSHNEPLQPTHPLQPG